MSNAIDEALAAQEQMMAAMRVGVEDEIAEAMGQLHNQFVSYVAAANIPLPHVVLVLDMLKRETIDQAYKQYLGD